MRITWVLWLFLFWSNLGFSQFQISVSTELKKRDIFLNVAGNYVMSSHQIGAYAGIGMLRTFNQQVFFPQVGLTYDYLFVSKERLKFGLATQWCFGSFILSESSRQRMNVIENYAGLVLETGKKLKFYTKILTGISDEVISPSVQHPVKTIGLGYQLTLGIKYEFKK